MDEIPLAPSSVETKDISAELERQKNHEKHEQEPVHPGPRRQFIRIVSPIYTPSFNYTDWAFFSGLVLVTLLAVGTRLYKLDEPHHVA